MDGVRVCFVISSCFYFTSTVFRHFISSDQTGISFYLNITSKTVHSIFSLHYKIEHVCSLFWIWNYKQVIYYVKKYRQLLSMYLFSLRYLNFCHVISFGKKRDIVSYHKIVHHLLVNTVWFHHISLSVISSNFALDIDNTQDMRIRHILFHLPH